MINTYIYVKTKKREMQIKKFQIFFVIIGLASVQLSSVFLEQRVTTRERRFTMFC